MSKWHQNVSWPLVAAAFQVCFAGYVLGIINQRLAAAVVADFNLAAKETEYGERFAAETDPKVKSGLEEIRTRFAVERANERAAQMLNGAVGQSLALVILAVAVFV